MSILLVIVLVVLLYFTLEASLAHKAVRDMTGHGNNGTWCESSPYLQDARETRFWIFAVMIVSWPTYIYVLYTHLTGGF